MDDKKLRQAGNGKLLPKGDLISDDIVADAGQFVAQRFGRKTCIGSFANLKLTP
jgi:hypothetical protein